MARESDIENQNNQHEETPLLSNEQSGQQYEHNVEPQTKRSIRIGWRISWAILGVVALTIFIKGWIDAGSDVKVG